MSSSAGPRFTEEVVLRLARHAYESGAARFHIVPELSALLVIDMQDEFVRPEWTPFWVPEATRQVSIIQRVVAAARKVGAPVIYTVFSATHGKADRPAVAGSMPNRYPELALDTEWFVEGRVWHELAPAPGEIVIHKPSYGAFYDTPLETILRNLGRDTIIICGTLTNYCCGVTARQGYERGFKVVVGSDVCATDDPAMQEPELRVLRKGFARVMSSSEIIDVLSSGTQLSGVRDEA